MKKIIFYVVLFVLSVFISGCSDIQTEYPVSTGEPIGTYDSESFVTIKTETDSPDDETKEEPLPPKEHSENQNGFLIKYKKYNYESNDLIIMELTNQSNSNYTVIVEGKFYNEQGKLLKTSRQKFEGWASGYRNYFLFRPMIRFDRFEFELKTEEFNGECFAKHLEIEGFQKLALTYRKTGLNGEYIQTGCVAVEARFPLVNKYDRELHYSAIYIVFDNKGAIHTLDSRLLQDGLYPGEYPDYGRIILQSDILWPNKDQYRLPTELQGEVNGIMIIRKVSDTPLA